MTMDSSNNNQSQSFVADQVLGCLRRIVVLNNLAEQLANVGEYEVSIACCRVALQGLVKVSNSRGCTDIQMNETILDLYIAQTNQKLFRSKSLACQPKRTIPKVYVSLSGMNITDCFWQVSERTDHEISTITFDILNASELTNESHCVEIISSILMYNLGIFYFLAATCETSALEPNDEKRPKRLNAGRRILALALNQMELEWEQLQQGCVEGMNQITVASNAEDIFRQLLVLSLLSLMSNGMFYVSKELCDAAAVTAIKKIHNEAQGNLFLWMKLSSKIFGAISCNHTAPTA